MSDEFVREVVSTAYALMMESTTRLLLGDDVDDAKWRQLARTCERAPEGDRERLRMFHDLAQVAISRSVETAEEVAGRIPRFEQNDLAYVLATAFAARLRSEAVSDPPADSWFKLATALYDLNGYAPSPEDAARGLVRVVSLLEQSAQAYTASPPADASAVAAVGQYVGLANEVAKRGNNDFLRSALASGDKTITTFANRSDADALGLAALCNNTINTCKTLARIDPSRAAVYLEKAVTFADVAAGSLGTAHERLQRPSMALTVHYATLGNLAYLHGMLALEVPAEFEQHAAASLRALDAHDEITSRLNDADERVRMSRMRSQLLARFTEARPDWRLPEQSKAEPSPEVTDDVFELSVRAPMVKAREKAEAIRALPTASAQQAALERVLQESYDVLRPNLALVFDETGVNHRNCRLLLAVGAVSSGRFGKLIEAEVLRWLTTERKADPPQTAREAIQWRQQQRPVRAAREEWVALGQIVALAALAAELSSDDLLSSFLLAAVRDRNAALLRNVLAQKHLTERDDTVSTRRRDVERLLDMIPDPGRTGFFTGY